jgi:hypothetical protein
MNEQQCSHVWTWRPVCGKCGMSEPQAENDALRKRVGELEVDRDLLIRSVNHHLAANAESVTRAEREEAERDVLREALEGMIAVAEGRFDGNPHADIDALAKARAALAPSPAGTEK